MARNVVFLLHGIGRQLVDGEPANSWHAPVVAALDAAWRRYDTLAARRREDYIEFVPISYDEVYRDYLAGMSDRAAVLRRYLPPSKAKAFFAELEGAGEEESFLWDDVVDALLYRYGADLYRNVHVVVQRQIMEAIIERWDTQGKSDVRFSMISHSLGTAVAHGALNRLGGGRLGAATSFQAGGAFFLDAYMTLANVSGVLWWGEHELYASTIVHPPLRSRPGYTNRFLNVRHVLDPIPMPKRFSPPNWGPAYSELVLDHVQAINVHAFEHYVAHPRVFGSFLQHLIGHDRLPTASIERALADFDSLSLVAEDQRPQLVALRDQLARSVRASFAGDRGLVPAVATLLGRATADLWKLRRELAKLAGLP